jgi:uncharacterized protein YggE
MKKLILGAFVLGGACLSGSVLAQPATITQAIAGTRLDITATGASTRTPDVAIISAGVVTHSQTATGAIQDAAERMQRVTAALKRAGVADRDIQTSNLSLNPEYKYENNQPPQLVGYTASNQLTVRFRDIRRAGTVLDALVSQGANQITGPNLAVDNPDSALDEARAKAIATGRARADLYAHALGLRVVRIVSVNESGGYAPPAPMMMMAARAKAADTNIEAGEQKLEVTLTMTFELQ